MDGAWPTRIIQAAQFAILANVFNSPTGLRVPVLFPLRLRIPLIRDVPARLIAFGVHQAQVANWLLERRSLDWELNLVSGFPS
jgi:hypothetical protein